VSNRTEMSFELQFPAAQLRAWAGRYPASDDNEAFEAGRLIKSGDYNPNKLRAIVKWKSRRPLPRLDRNTGEEMSVNRR